MQEMPMWIVAGVLLILSLPALCGLGRDGDACPTPPSPRRCAPYAAGRPVYACRVRPVQRP